MSVDTYPLRTLHLAVSGRVHRNHADVIAYLVEENRMPLQWLELRRLRLDDMQEALCALVAARIRLDEQPKHARGIQGYSSSSCSARVSARTVSEGS